MGYRETVVKIARSQLGQAEPVQDDKYIQYYNQLEGTKISMDAPWCAMFASWVLRQAKVSEDLMPNFASCGEAIKWAKKKKTWYSRLTSHIPAVGELVFFDWDGDTLQDHVGIVVSVTTNNITTIEGNSGNKVSEKVYAKSSKHILGYIDIQYPEPVDMGIKGAQKFLVDVYGATLAVDGIWGGRSKRTMIVCLQKELNKSHGAHLVVDGFFGSASKKSFPIVKSGAKGNLVKMIQYLLNINGAKLTVDGVCGAKTIAAVKNYQKTKKLDVDGLVGPATMASLLR